MSTGDEIVRTKGHDETQERLRSVVFSEKARECMQAIAPQIADIMAYVIDELPAGRDTSMLLTKLEEAHMWAGKACRGVGVTAFQCEIHGVLNCSTCGNGRRVEK